MLPVERSANFAAVQLPERNNLDGAKCFKYILCSRTEAQFFRRDERAASDQIDLHLDIDTLRRYLQLCDILSMRHAGLWNNSLNARFDPFEGRGNVGQRCSPILD